MNETQRKELNKIFLFSEDFLSFMKESEKLNINDSEKTDYFLKNSNNTIGTNFSNKDIVMLKQGITGYKIIVTTLI